MRILVLQHIACEPPGEYEEVILERGIEIRRVELDQGESLPDRRGFDAIVAMGGPMSVTDDAELPWLADEKVLIEEAVRAGVPYWGVCLGAQLLAASLGARVYAGPAPEVGLMTVRTTDDAAADPVFAGLPRELPALQWHGDTFELPEGATHLAGSDAYANQAFRWGDSAYGVQFHLEVSEALAEEWVSEGEYREYLHRALGAGSLPKLLGDLQARGAELRSNGRLMFGRCGTCQ